MTQVSREQFLRAMDDAGIPEEALKEDYSGRAMYGDTCPGIVCNTGDILLFAAALGSFADDWDWVGNVSSDSFGMSAIWYWQGVKLVEEDV